MLVYRLEDRWGYGPWAMSGAWDNHATRLSMLWERYGILGELIEPGAMPEPHDDRPISGEWPTGRHIADDWRRQHRFAYPSLGRLFKWWGPSRDLPHGTKIVVYNVDNPVTWENQVAFKPEAATRLGAMTMDDGWAHFMQGSDLHIPGIINARNTLY